MSPLLVGAALGATGALILDRRQVRRRAPVRDEPVTDEVVCARVHSKIGRHSSHPGAIEVTALDGRVALTGDVLRRELDRLIAAARAVPGVHHVENQLRVHESAEHVSALQGDTGEVFQKTRRPGLLYALVLGAVLLACAVKASLRPG